LQKLEAIKEHGEAFVEVERLRIVMSSHYLPGPKLRFITLELSHDVLTLLGPHGFIMASRKQKKKAA
jgi:hypothetical protein